MLTENRFKGAPPKALKKIPCKRKVSAVGIKKTCVDCHFLCKNGIDIHLLSKEERGKIKKGNFEFLEGMSLNCYKKCWHEDITQEIRGNRYNLIAEKDRSDCFFTEYRQNMLFSAVEELEKRECDYREANSDRRLTRQGLYIAAAAIFFAPFVDKIVGRFWSLLAALVSGVGS